MRVGKLTVFKEPLYAALIVFSVVSLATLEFLKNAFPSTDALRVPKSTVVDMIVLAQVLPAVLLWVADRLIAAWDKSGRLLRVYRSVLFVVALVLIGRQLQLYWGPASDFTDTLRSWGSAPLVLGHLIILAAIVGFAIWLFRGLVLFFLYMSPVAIVMSAMIPSDVPTGVGLPDAHDQEIATAIRSESQPAVFVLIFDELGYDVLVDEEGKPDAESFPNIAALAQDGVWFTNATTNYFWSAQAIPPITDTVVPLAEDFDIRLYIQAFYQESLYINDCGRVVTCRGYGYFTENEQLRVASQLSLRAFYQATPKWMETAISRPMGWFLDRLGWAYPTANRIGWHTFTKRQFSVLLDDIKGREALGRIHVLHLLLPHDPRAFNAEGNALSTSPVDSSDPADPERYRQQTMFVDVLVGRLVNKLEREGIYDETVIVLTGDHGVRTFIPSAEVAPLNSTPRVPLVIRAPGLNSGVSDVDYQHMDFGLTLTDLLGLPPPDDAEGVSAFSKERPQRDKVFYVDNLRFIYSQEHDSWLFTGEEKPE